VGMVSQAEFSSRLRVRTRTITVGSNLHYIVANINLVTALVLWAMAEGINSLYTAPFHGIPTWPFKKSPDALYLWAPLLAQSHPETFQIAK